MCLHVLVWRCQHEMIHAYLFLTNGNTDRDGHGPAFMGHARRINSDAGTNITVYHTFHDEVNAYLKHVWKCDVRASACQHCARGQGASSRGCVPGPMSTPRALLWPGETGNEPRAWSARHVVGPSPGTNAYQPPPHLLWPR